LGNPQNVVQNWDFQRNSAAVLHSLKPLPSELHHCRDNGPANRFFTSPQSLLARKSGRLAKVGQGKM
jgi:hypothetical protein